MLSSLYEGKFLTEGAGADPFARNIPSLADLESLMAEEDRMETEKEAGTGGSEEAQEWGGDDATTVDVESSGDADLPPMGEQEEDDALMAEMRREAEAEAADSESGQLHED